MNTQHVTVDLSKSPTYAQMVTIGQGDSGGTTIVADVYDNGKSVSLSGMTAAFCMRFPQDVGYVRDSGCTVSGNQITYVVNESRCGAMAVRVDECYFELLSGNRKYSTSRFRIMVARAADDDAQPAETWDSAFDVWKAQKDAQVNAAVSSANSAASSANSAASSATSAASSATSAASSANTAASSVNAAKNAANTAASSANSAASDARAAASSATNAASDARTAANAANSATAEVSAVIASARQAESDMSEYRDQVEELARSLPLGLYIDEDGDMCQE